MNIDYRSLENLLNWELLSKIGKNKIIKSSIIWVALIPILVKIIEFMSNTHSVSITLPFSWTLFYYSAIFFMIGNIIFQFTCPKIIYENVSYFDFDNKGLGTIRLLSYSKHKVNIESDIQIGEFSNNLDSKLIFGRLWDATLLDKRFLRIVIVIIYSIGFILFAKVFIQNFLTVFNYTT